MMLTQPNITIGLVQINNSFSGQSYLPYTAGQLQAYVEKFAKAKERYAFILPIYKREHIDKNLEHLSGADVIAFSAYVWNINISLETAKQHRVSHPDSLIIFGGPQVPDNAEEFLRANPFIDIAVHGAGEQTFLDILESIPGDDWKKSQGLSYLDKHGVFISNEARPRPRDISEFPSPYLAGTFDKLMKENFAEKWIVMWETNRGCPFSCTFCDWGSATASKVVSFDMGQIESEIDWFSKNKIEFIFCCDANFGILKRDVQIVSKVAENKNIYGFPRAFSVQNTKNATERAYLTQKILNDAGLNKGVTVSLQSLDEKTLEYIKRDNISLDTYEELQRRFTSDGVITYSDLILGLPGETCESFINGIGRCIENGQHNRIQFNNLSILPNAEMGAQEYQEKHGMKLVESRTVNIHGAWEDHGDGIFETQLLCVGTNSMPPRDWRDARATCWMTALLYFDKLLQLPILVAHKITGLSYTNIIKGFMKADSYKYPLISEIALFFEEEAHRIQNGGVEYVFSKEWLGIFWPADEYMYIKLSINEQLEQFYQESEQLIKDLSSGAIPKEIIRDSTLYNRQLLCQPFQPDDVVIELSHNLSEFYDNLGDKCEIKHEPSIVTISRSQNSWESWEEWMEKVVWFGNKKGAYLYNNTNFEKAIAGHH